MADNKKAIDKNYLLTQFKNFDSGLLSKKYSSIEETAEIEKAVFADVNVFETESANDFSIFNNNYGPSNVYWEYNNTSIKIGDVLVIKKDLTLSGTYTNYDGTSYSTTVTLPKGNYRYLKKFIKGGGAVSGIFVANTTTSFFDPSYSEYGQYWQTLESKNIAKLDEFETEVTKEFNLIRNNLIFPNVTTTQEIGGGMGLSFILSNASRSDVKVGDIVYVSKEISVSFSGRTGTFKKGFYKCTSIYYDSYNGGSWWVIFNNNGSVNNEYLGATLTDSILSTMVSDLYGGAIGESGKDGSKIWLFTGSTLTDYNRSSYWDVPFTKLAGQEGTPVKGDFVLGRSGDSASSYSKGTRLVPINLVTDSTAQIQYSDFNKSPELGAEHLGAASGTAAGIVTTTTQSFKGKKTFLPEGSGSYGSFIDGGSVCIGNGLYGYDYSPGYGSCNEASILLGFENPEEGAEPIGYAFSGSIGMGYAPYANNQSAAIGHLPHAENTSIAIGTSTTALNNSSGFGESCYADKWAHAQGYKTTAINLGSHAEGSQTYSKSYLTSSGNMGQGVHAEGYKTSAMGGPSGYGIHAEGTNTYASDIGAYYGGEHAEGYSTSSCGGHYGGGTHAEGSYTRAYNGGHAEGYFTSCGTSDSPVGAFCHAEGYYTSASSGTYGQHVSGKYNKGNSSNILEVGNGSSNTARSNAFTVTYAGEVKAASTITGSTTADYAEYFEWKDGNPNNEDRICKFVTLDGNKITTATSNEDYILGVVSVEPFVLGNADIDNWNGMYVRDKFGRIVYEDRQLTYLNVETGEEEISYDADRNPVIEKIPVINPDFDPDREYVGRADRPEWSPVGMLGQLLVYQDGTAEVNKYVCCNEEGIATSCDRKTENAYRVIEVIDDELVRIIFK